MSYCNWVNLFSFLKQFHSWKYLFSFAPSSLQSMIITFVSYVGEKVEFCVLWIWLGVPQFDLLIWFGVYQESSYFNVKKQSSTVYILEFASHSILINSVLNVLFSILGIIRSCSKWRKELGDLRHDWRTKVKDVGFAGNWKNCRRGWKREGRGGSSKEERKIRKEIRE